MKNWKQLLLNIWKQVEFIIIAWFIIMVCFFVEICFISLAFDKNIFGLLGAIGWPVFLFVTIIKSLNK